MSLERYVELYAALIGVDEAARGETLAALGSTPSELEALTQRWQSPLAYDPETSRRFDALIMQRLGPICADAPPLSFDDYLELAVLSCTGQDPQPRLDALGLDMRAYYFRGYEWKTRFAEDTRLGAYFRIKQNLAIAAFGKEKSALPEPAPASIVWANRCPQCGAHKVTESRTAYIYCDYCSRLFDYDWSRARDELFGVDPAAVFQAIVDGARAEIRASFAAEDWDTYREAWRWVYGVDVELFPDSWSPRATEPAYREAIVDFSVETCFLEARDPALRRAKTLNARAFETPGDRREREPLLAHWAALAEAMNVRALAYERAGVFALHPDQLTPERFARINLGHSIAPLLEAARPDAREALLDESGFRRQAVEVPPAELHPSTCGRCGGRLLVADGAKRTLCEDCGEMLDAERPRFPCPSCGSPVVLAKSDELSCAYCEARFTRT